MKKIIIIVVALVLVIAIALGAWYYQKKQKEKKSKIESEKSSVDLSSILPGREPKISASFQKFLDTNPAGATEGDTGKGRTK